MSDSVSKPPSDESVGSSPFQEAPTAEAAIGFCLRCQAALLESPFEPACPKCGLQFDPRNAESYLRERKFLCWKYWFPAFCLAVASGVISYAVCIQSGELGLALFVAVPVSCGAIIGYGTRARWWALGLLGIAMVISVVVGLMSMHVAGFFCGLTLSIIFLAPALFGIILGLVLRKILEYTKWDQRWYFPLVLFLALPYASQWLENMLPSRSEIASVRTQLTVDATPLEAWNAVMFYEEVQHRPPWLLRLALPRPVRSVGDKQRVGDVVRCYYDRGYLAKRISRRDEGRLLAFEVIEQQLHFERDVTLRDGSFEILSAPDGQSRIVLTTRYQRHLSPRWIWQPIERMVVHSLHGHVLEGMRRHAESHPLPNPDPLPDIDPYRKPASVQLVRMRPPHEVTP